MSRPATLSTTSAQVDTADTLPQWRVTHARDADQHAQNLSQWDQRYDQLSCGTFEGSVTELWLPKTQVFVETANRQLRQTCAAWSDSVWFGIPAAREGMISMGGRPLSANAVCIRDGGAEFDLMTAPDFNLFGIVVDRQALAAYLADITHQDLDRLLRQGDVLDLQSSLKLNLCSTLSSILADAESPVARNSTAAELQDRIFAALADILLAGKQAEDTLSRSRYQRQRIVAKVQHLLLENPEYPPSIPELCNQLHISRRALQNCFESMTGMAPLAYMRSLRLNEVRRALRQDPSGRPISNVAYAWGFNHLSQFARDYRRMFGELPSASRRTS